MSTRDTPQSHRKRQDASLDILLIDNLARPGPDAQPELLPSMLPAGYMIYIRNPVSQTNHALVGKTRRHLPA
jgi:hypothetical protein